MTAELAQAFGLEGNTGAVVAEVTPSSPAAVAGLMAGDVITKVNEQAVNGQNNVSDLFSALKPGTVATLRVFRDRRPVTLRATLGDRRAKTNVPAIPAFAPGSVPSIAPPREIAPPHVFVPPPAPLPVVPCDEKLVPSQCAGVPPRTADAAVVNQPLPANRPAAMRDGWVRRMLDYRGVMFLERFGPVNVPEFGADLDLNAAGSVIDCRTVQSTGNGDIDLALCAATRSGNWISATNGAGQPIPATLRITIPKFRLSAD